MRTRLDRPSFSIYSLDNPRFPFAPCRRMRDVSLRSLLKVKDLWARAEQSGCEGCYVEVAKWNAGSQRWERFAFEKFFGGEMWDGLNAEETAMRVAAIINRVNPGYLCSNHLLAPGKNYGLRKPISVVKVQQQEVTGIIHSMPSWNPIRTAAA